MWLTAARAGLRQRKREALQLQGYCITYPSFVQPQRESVTPGRDGPSEAERLKWEGCIGLVKPPTAVGAALAPPNTGDAFPAMAWTTRDGSMLTGGVGLVAATLFGGMIFGLIATPIDFDGLLNGAGS